MLNSRNTQRIHNRPPFARLENNVCRNGVVELYEVEISTSDWWKVLGKKHYRYSIGICPICPKGWQRENPRVDSCDGKYVEVGCRYEAPTRVDCACAAGPRPGFEKVLRFGEWFGQFVMAQFGVNDATLKWQVCHLCKGSRLVDGEPVIIAFPQRFVDFGGQFVPFDKNSDRYLDIELQLRKRPIMDKSGRYMKPSDYGLWQVSFHSEVVEMRIERHWVEYDSN